MKFLRLFFILCFVFISSSAATAQLSAFENEILAYEELTKKSPPPDNCTLFIGSSTWTQWGTLLEQDFSSFKAVNRGFGGSTIADVLLVMDRLIPPINPARIILFCGTNDIAKGADVDSVFLNLNYFIHSVWAINASVQIYIVSLTHAPVRQRFWKNGDLYNKKVKKLVKKTKGLHYIDLIKVLNRTNGKINTDLFKTDCLHLNRRGQERCIPVIKKELIGG